MHKIRIELQDDGQLERKKSFKHPLHKNTDQILVHAIFDETIKLKFKGQALNLPSVKGRMVIIINYLII